MFQKTIKISILVIVCVNVFCSCSSPRTLRSNTGFSVYSSTDILPFYGVGQYLLILDKSNNEYDFIESSYPQHYSDRSETGRWSQGHDTLYLYPQWEIRNKGRDSYPRDLSQKENIDCFNMEKRFLVRKKGLEGIKSNMPSSLDSIVIAEDWSVFYNCHCEKMILYLVSDFYMKPFNKKLYK